jgi:plasmid maintenance system antidote protein VapI
LAEISIPATGKGKAEIARLLGISRQALYDIIGKRQAVTPSVAIKLGKLFGNGPSSGCELSRPMTFGMPSESWPRS